MSKINVLIVSVAVVTGLLIGCSQQSDETQLVHTPAEGITIIERVSEEGNGVRVVLSGEEAYDRFMNDSSKFADTLSLASSDERDPLELIREEFRVIEAQMEANEPSLSLNSGDCDNGDFSVDADTFTTNFLGVLRADAEASAVGCGDSENGVSVRASGDERSERDRDDSTGDEEISARATGEGAGCVAVAAASVRPGDSVGDFSDCGD
jgi:hypothetical protein